ncbi:hypothetical protein MKQ70_07075 [Chitinophaga sedimenti]|uniref:hypothetical protein n=1 Tax=Chitinophaga sedimenti TaxID=2033606 RepID=UPI0020055DC9|nr:hypothetical protein [Chitinophaga sedimenti]MCK7554775.1 hypothetical protein [Chitinophaga sedimenti]
MMKRLMIVGCTVCALFAGKVNAQELGYTSTQVDPLPSMYFQNQYWATRPSPVLTPACT